ncbi:MAG: dephospho-CoA kinase [Bdellovibrio sp.]
MWIGLTGGIASGKSTVAEILRAQGCPVIDADALARLVVSPGSEALALIEKKFGSEFLDSEGSLNREKMGSLIFSDPQARQQLECIVHPWVQKECQRLKQVYLAQGAVLIFYDVPLLFEKQMQDQFDSVVLVSAREDLQRQRLKLRSNLQENEISNRLAAQMLLSAKEATADFVIPNNTTLEDLKTKTLEVLQLLRLEAQAADPHPL